MITATFFYDEAERIVGFRVSGHAMSAPYGEDLVCAAASAIAFGGANALLDEGYETKTGEGELEIRNRKGISLHDQTVLMTILRQFETLEASNKKYVRVERKRT